jgi:ribonucleoside-diphosphate reductase subunit M2
MNKDSNFAERIVAFAAAEGVLFSGSFCAIYWLFSVAVDLPTGLSQLRRQCASCPLGIAVQCTPRLILRHTQAEEAWPDARPDLLQRASRDEGLHVEFACLLDGMLHHQLPEDVVHDIVRGAVDAERNFTCEALPCDLIGMNLREACR